MDNKKRCAMIRDLTHELNAAHFRHSAASKRFHLLLKEIPSGLGLPNPDALQRIHEAGKEAHASLDEYVGALQRFTDFTVHRIIPSDLNPPKE